MTPSDPLPPIAPRAEDAHKGTMGRLLIIGGSRGLSGAVILAARAALRSGAGLVTAALPHSSSLPFDVACAEGMSLALPEDPEGALTTAGFPLLVPSLDRADAVVIGPGLGRASTTEALFAQVLDRYTGPLVIDADGLWHLARDRSRLASPAFPVNRVLTPHDGEFRRLQEALGLATGDRDEECLAWTRRVPGVLVRKGPATRIVCGDRIARNDTGNPGLATGGTGDVLAGVIGALLARAAANGTSNDGTFNDGVFEAARRGAWLHGRAGDRARDRLGEESMIASDVIDELPGAFRDASAAQKQHDPKQHDPKQTRPTSS